MIARKQPAIILLFSFFLLAAGCRPVQPEAAKLQGASITGAALEETSPGEQAYFKILVHNYGDPVGIDFRGVLLNGGLKVRLVGAAGEIAWQEQVGAGNFVINTTLFTLEPGEYQLGVAWEGLVQASFNLKWKPGPIEEPVLSPLVLVSGLGMLAVSAGFIGFALFRLLGWRNLLLGGFVWLVAVLLKSIVALQVNTPLQELLNRSLPARAATSISYLYLGCLSGVFEVGVVFLILRYSQLGEADWRQALAFGIGFGALEALLLALNPLVSATIGLFQPARLSPNLIEGMQVLNNPLYSLAPVAERFSMLWVHICSSVLLFYSVVKREMRWFWIAFFYEILVNAAAAFGQFSSLESLGKIWAFEAVMLLLGLAGWWGTLMVNKRYPGREVTMVER